MAEHVTPPGTRPILSVIVPMYNVEAFIEDCLGSLNGQLPAGELEIVVVDDAATDGSMARVEHFLDEHPDAPVKVVRHAQNRGLGEARRTGFEASTGTYVWCLDSDDLAAPGSLPMLVGELRLLPEDTILLFRDYAIVDVNGESTGGRRPGIRVPLEALAATEYVRLFLRGEASPNITNKVFRRDKVDVMDLSSRRIWEDNPTVIALMSRFGEVRVTDLLVYQIRERASSIMRSDVQLKASRAELVEEVVAEVESRFGDAYARELPYYRLNAGVMEDILTVASRQADAGSARRQVRSLSRAIEWPAVARAFRSGKPRTGFVASSVKILPGLSTMALRFVMSVGTWRR